MGKTNFFLSTLPFNPWVVLATWFACRSFSKNIRKTNLITIFNKTSPHAHMELELDVLGVHGKLVKYVVYSYEKKIGKNLFFFIQTAIDQFLISRNFRG
jgi:hypothetical protein